LLCLISSKMPLVEPQHNVPRQAAMAAAIAGAWWNYGNTFGSAQATLPLNKNNIPDRIAAGIHGHDAIVT
jgi:hypothetical protein